METKHKALVQKLRERAAYFQKLSTSFQQPAKQRYGAIAEELERIVEEEIAAELRGFEEPTAEQKQANQWANFGPGVCPDEG